MAHEYRYRYALPGVAADTAVFRLHADTLEILLVERKYDPCLGMWALPGGFVEVGGGFKAGEAQGEELDAAARRELREETGLHLGAAYVLRQVGAFGTPGRDPRGRVISIVHYVFIDGATSTQVQAADDAAKVGWCPVAKPPALAFDHAEVLACALQVARDACRLSPAPLAPALGPTFTPAALRSAYQALFGPEWNPNRFDRDLAAMLADGVVGRTGELLRLA